jgi:hypothetical protein
MRLQVPLNFPIDIRLINSERLNLTDFTYKNKRYTQYLDESAPEWSKEVYYDLIKTDVI